MQLPFLPYRQLAASLALALPMLYATGAGDGGHGCGVEFLVREQGPHPAGLAR